MTLNFALIIDLPERLAYDFTYVTAICYDEYVGEMRPLINPEFQANTSFYLTQEGALYLQNISS